MPLRPLVLVLVSVTISAVAQIAFKYGVMSEPTLTAKTLLGPLAKLLTPGVLIGLSLYGLGVLIWLSALEGIELSRAYPFVGLGFAITTLAGWWLFGDSLSAQKLMGIGLIILGTLLLADLKPSLT